MTPRQQQIFDYIKQKNTIKSGELQKVLGIERTILYREIKKLLDGGYITSPSKGLYAYLPPISDYLSIPYFSRAEKTYNESFLGSYIPNTSFLLSTEQRKKLHTATSQLHISTDYYKTNRRIIEITLIDVTYASSSLEGNTYSYLDTEVLIKYNEIAKNQSKEDTQMILNHKNVIEYLLNYKYELPYSMTTFFEVHTFLGKKLLHTDELGIIRNGLVKIGGSSYTPIDNRYQLEEQFQIFLEKLTQITDPFEQSIFILTFIPYFQLFWDINKRTSRILCNLPLLKNNLPLLSLLQVQPRTYIDAILAIYELNDIRPLASLYTDNYLLNMDRYIPYHGRR